MSENECNGLTTAKYLVAADALAQNPPREATGRTRLLASATLLSVIFLLAAGLGTCYQIYLPVLQKRASTLWTDVAKPLAGTESPQTTFRELLIKNHADIMAEIQQRNNANPVNPRRREGWSQQDWDIGKAGFQPAPFGS